IMFHEQAIGTVMIAVSRETVDAEMRNMVIQNLSIGAIVVLLISAGIYFIFHRYVIFPIRQLSYGAERVAGGVLHEPIAISSVDELGQLARSFNRMMDNLHQADAQRNEATAKLNEFNRTLEQRVEERTQAIERANRELEHMALYDSLTSLPNRVSMKDRLERVLAAAVLRGEKFVVAVMDIDRFKEVNETLGHHAGDELLYNISERVKKGLRTADTLARFGSDEFALIFPDLNMNNAHAVLKKLLHVLDEPVIIGGINIKITATIGAAVYPDQAGDVETLLKRADIALYEAKNKEMDYCFYSTEIDSYSPRRLSLMADLQKAMANGELQLYYQTIFDLSTGAVRGMEALARWPHPRYGFIQPIEFISMIEQTGFIKSFTYWAVDSALAQHAKWRDQYKNVVVSVNLAMRNLQDRDFPDQVAELVKKWSVQPHTLMLEITEGGVMHNPVFVLEMLNKFRALNVDVAIDDFGTGYSSLTYLKRLPVQEVKIDRSFIKDIITHKEDAAIVRSVIDLAHNLNLKVVAEGVGNEETLNALHKMGCDYVQGYFMSMPVKPDDVKFENMRQLN
ncbi:MAG: EAL domain-containing protein, partial [Pseudomonadota bacterium]